MSWRYRGGPGSGALADIGSHLVDLAEFFCGPIASVARRGAVDLRQGAPLPLGAAVGSRRPRSSDVTRAGGERGRRDVHCHLRVRRRRHLLGVPRSRTGIPTRWASSSSASAARRRSTSTGPAEFRFVDGMRRRATQGYRQVLVGPAHPYLAGGLPMDFPSVGHGQNDLFIFQARAFLEQVAGSTASRRCPRSPTACTTCVCRRRSLPPPPRGTERSFPSASNEKGRSHETRCVYRLSCTTGRCRSADRCSRELGLDSAEINSGGFLPAGAPAHRRAASQQDRSRRLSRPSSTDAGIALTALNCNGNPLDPSPTSVRSRADLLALDRGRRATRASSGWSPCPAPRRRPGRHRARPGWCCPGTASTSMPGTTCGTTWRSRSGRTCRPEPRDADVKVCIEMHPHNIVFNPATMERLATEIDATHVGAEMDPSHLFWQGIDPVPARECARPPRLQRCREGHPHQRGRQGQRCPR